MGSIIGAGYYNTITADDSGSAYYSIIGAGVRNQITADDGHAPQNIIGGGESNMIAAHGGGNAYQNIIGAGVSNMIVAYGTGLAYDNIIGAGLSNTITVSDSDTARSSIIGAGQWNDMSGAMSGIVSGSGNNVSGIASFIGAGYNNSASGNCSVALGAQASDAGYNNNFVWSDGSTLFTSTAVNTFSVLATNGARFVTSSNGSTAAYLPGGSGSWISVSNKNLKENYQEVDTVQVLEKVASMPLETWNYKAQDASIRHMGPYAQDFYAAFSLGEDPLGINTIDIDGVNFAAIQGLYTVHKKDIARLSSEIAELREQLQLILTDRAVARFVR